MSDTPRIVLPNSDTAPLAGSLRAAFTQAEYREPGPWILKETL